MFGAFKEKLPWQDNGDGGYGNYAQENSLDLSGHTTLPGRRSSIFNQFNHSSLPPWQNPVEDPLNLSGHSTLPGRRSSVYESYDRFLEPFLEPDGESQAQASPGRRRSGEPRIQPDEPINPINPINPIIPMIPIQEEPAQAEDPAQRYSSFFTGEDIPRRKHRILPGHAQSATQMTQMNNLVESRQNDREHHAFNTNEVKRSWPEPRQKGERRISASNYSAVEIHGFFGLIDDGSAGEGRMLVVHVPKWIRGYFLDIKQGDTLHVYHAKGKKIGGALTVLSTGRHRYYAPGRRVTTCTVCVPEEQWAPFRLF